MFRNLNSFLNNETYKVSLLPNKVHILNYKSIIDINSNSVIIKLDNNLCKIYGSDIKLVKLDQKELLISGIFERININEK